VKLTSLTFNSEPTAWIGFVRALLYVLVIVFHVQLSDVQQIALLALFETGAVLLNRSQVTPMNPTPPKPPEMEPVTPPTR